MKKILPNEQSHFDTDPCEPQGVVPEEWRGYVGYHHSLSTDSVPAHPLAALEFCQQCFTEAVHLERRFAAACSRLSQLADSKYFNLSRLVDSNEVRRKDPAVMLWSKIIGGQITLYASPTHGGFTPTSTFPSCELTDYRTLPTLDESGDHSSSVLIRFNPVAPVLNRNIDLSEASKDLCKIASNALRSAVQRGLYSVAMELNCRCDVIIRDWPELHFDEFSIMTPSERYQHHKHRSDDFAD